jgi:YVTN family beta-propeller protein
MNLIETGRIARQASNALIPAKNLWLRGAWCSACVLVALQAGAQPPAPLLLALEKGDNTLAIIDPAALKIVAHIPAGPDPHEVIASEDGRRAYISNYGGEGSALNTISVVSVDEKMPLAPIDLGALHSPHGLAMANGKLYFTAESSKVIARYDPNAQRVDWILGTGQDRTHMLIVTGSRIVTSNVRSGTISILEEVSVSGGPGGSAAPTSSSWSVSNVRSGNGCEGFDIAPNGREILAANAKDDTVTIIDPVAKSVIQTIPIPVQGANRLKFTPDGRRVLISGLGSGAGPAGASGENLAVFDAASRRQLKTLNLGGGAAGILIAPDGSRAYIAVSPRNRIAVVDLKSIAVVHEIPTGDRPDGLAWAVHK